MSSRTLTAATLDEIHRVAGKTELIAGGTALLLLIRAVEAMVSSETEPQDACTSPMQFEPAGCRRTDHSRLDGNGDRLAQGKWSRARRRRLWAIRYRVRIHGPCRRGAAG
jgi:hypothetical protein